MENPIFCVEPVNVSQLEEKEIYFMLNYFDVDLYVPELRTLIFLGHDVAEKDDALFYFQDIESYIKLGPYPNSSNGPGDIFYCTEEQLGCFFTLDKAVLALQDCIARRAKKYKGSISIKWC